MMFVPRDVWVTAKETQLLSVRATGNYVKIV
jgi:hypothetical protein